VGRLHKGKFLNNDINGIAEKARINTIDHLPSERLSGTGN
jgi:hypothetical protein